MGPLEFTVWFCKNWNYVNQTGLLIETRGLLLSTCLCITQSLSDVVQAAKGKLKVEESRIENTKGYDGKVEEGWIMGQ